MGKAYRLKEVASYMPDYILAILALAFIVFIFIAGYHLHRRTDQAKGFALYSLFILIFVSGAIAGCGTTNEPTDKVAVSQSNTGQELAPQTEPDSNDSNQKGDQSLTNNNNDKDKPISNEATGTLKVHYIDVGQADSILVQLPSGQNMLIDAGNNSDSDQVINYLKSNDVKKLDHVIGSHPHEDHIGGLDAAIENFDVGKVYLPRVSHTTKTYEDLLLAIKNKGLKVTEAKGGVKLDVGHVITAELLAPNGTGYDNLNNFSAVLRLTFGNTSFLFTGDAEDISENQMLRAGYNLKADVLKVGHHGSTSSTSVAFLKAISPKYAVICVGKDNTYGHPHTETLSNLASADAQVFRTDRQGTIIATSDGKIVTFNTEPFLSGTSINTGSPSAPSNSTSATPPTTGVSSSASGVVIASIDLGAELVTMKNNSGAAINLSGWKLISEKGNQEFTFPSGTTLAPGGTIKIVTGPNATAGPGVFVWTTKNIWNNDGDPGALYDSSGKLVSRYPR